MTGRPHARANVAVVLRLRARRNPFAAGGLLFGMTALGATIVAPPAPRLLWNASASAPVGLYGVNPGTPVQPGDMVVVRLPPRWRLFAARRGYLPANVPLVKRVAAGAGARICARGAHIFLNGRRIAQRRAVDGQGRAMPHWQGCRRLGTGQWFLLMAGSAASFDGRYFGVSERGDIVGKARLLWAG